MITATNRAILAIALPAMLTNVATAMIGLVDVWTIGRLGQADLQAATEIGAKLFFFVVGLTIFLRFGTTGLTAQAAGRDDARGEAVVLARALALAAVIAVAVGLAKPFVVPAGLAALGADGEVADAARAYLGWRYWAIPAAIVNFTLSGWLIGRRRVRAVLGVEIGYNLVHIGLALTLVLHLGFGVRGVAAASCAAELFKLIVLALVTARQEPTRQLRAVVRDASTWAREGIAALLRLNRDLFLRTLLLLVAIMIFVRLGARQGSVVLAANAVLFQLFLMAGLILDGFESAAQVLGGEAAGRGDRTAFRALTRRLLVWMAATALVLTVVLTLGGDALTGVFSRDPRVVAALGIYRPWLLALPLLASVSFVFDGLFVGASWTRAMLVSMAWSFVAFGVLLWLTRNWGNHGLWLSYAAMFVARGAAQAMLLGGLERRSFENAVPMPLPALVV